MRHSVCKGAGVFCRDRPPRRIIQPPGTDASASQTHGHDPRGQTNRQKRTQTAAKVNPTAPGHPAPASLTPCALSNTRDFGGIDLSFDASNLDRKPLTMDVLAFCFQLPRASAGERII